MNWLSKVTPIIEATKIQDLSLQELLMELKKYGKPKVGMYGNDDTWHCTIDMNTNTVGAEFKCRSDFNHTTPIEATKQCLDRVIKAVEQYRDGK